MPPAAPTHMELISSDLYHVSGPCCVYSVNLMYILQNGKQHQLLQLMSRVVTSGSPGHMWDPAAVMSSLQQKLPGNNKSKPLLWPSWSNIFFGSSISRKYWTHFQKFGKRKYLEEEANLAFCHWGRRGRCEGDSSWYQVSFTILPWQPKT